MNSQDISHVKDYRKLLIEALGGKCQKCGNSDTPIIHHKHYRKEGTTLDDIELLCKKCHSKIKKRTKQSLSGMSSKIVLETDEELWRQVKSRAALEGKKIDEMVRILIKKGLNVKVTVSPISGVGSNENP